MWMNPNNKGYIRATTISSEKFIIIGSENIELSGNVIMKNDVTLSSGLFNTNSIVPNITNSKSLGTSSKIWSNAYIHDLSINNNIEISGNTIINGVLQAPNIYTNSLDVSGNVTFKGSTLYVPSSFTIDPMGHGDNTGTLLINGNLVVQGVTTTINSSVVDISDKILVLASNASNSLQADGAGFEISGAKVNFLYNNSSASFRSSIGISISGNVVPLTNSVGSLGETGKIWSNAYIRDISATNIEVSGNIMPLRDISSNLGSSLNRWNYIYVNDLSVNTINGTAYSAGGGGGSTVLTSITSNVVPATTNTYNLGDVSRNWNTAYINNLKVSNRVYQEISNNSNWSAVNGHYGLAKQSFPALNPLSSGAKALAYWSSRSTSNRPSGFTFNLRTIVWAPKLRMFLTFSSGAWGESGAMYSYDGINWINIFSSFALLWGVKGLCWSEELGIFVAVSHRHPKVIYSYNGIDWYSNTTFTANGVTTGSSFSNVCWSPELGIFVAVSEDINLEYKAFISNNGINWIAAPGSINIFIKWGCVCWSPQLGLFVATPTDYRGGSVGDPPVSVTSFVVMTSYDGYTWTVRSFPSIVSEYPNWDSIAWSPQLGLFVAVSWQGGTNDASIVTSNDGINWVVRRITNPHQQIRSVCWSAELGLFVAASAIQYDGIYMYSSNGTIWQDFENIQENGEYISFNAQGVCWSPELGIFVAVGGNNIWTSVLKGRIPTITNVFDSSFNRIDETGKWTFQNLGVTGTFTNTSDDRLKHNEIIINNGLAIIDSLTPKFYQKTLTMLDASYNGDLSTQAWTYEAGVIAQELLQISDLSFVVSGGNYYQERYIYSRPTNDPSNTNYDPCFNIYDISNANYDPSLNIYDISNANYTISNTLITQTYSVNYNSVFVYGLAAIKELHTKVKAQETSISSLQTSMLEQQATLNSVLTRLQALETGAN